MDIFLRAREEARAVTIARGLTRAMAAAHARARAVRLDALLNIVRALEVFVLHVKHEDPVPRHLLLLLLLLDFVVDHLEERVEEEDQQPDAGEA